MCDTNLLNLEAERLASYQNGVKDFWNSCQGKNSSVPCKILVTYDSFGRVKEALKSIGAFDEFNVVVDEFQSVFVDSKFKSTTEMKFLTFLKMCDRVCFVSATPMMENYLDQLDEFKDLPYFEFDWNALQPGRIIKPDLDVKLSKSITTNVTG
jgi:hypothetical protein